MFVRAARSVQAGQGVVKDDIADIERVEMGVAIPDDAGFLFVFSVGWRKGLYYDFGPICGPYSQPREYDVPIMLGHLFRNLLFQERYSISNEEWAALFASQWFPFTALGDFWINKLIADVRSGWNPDDNLDGIAEEVNSRLPKMLDSWSNTHSFQPHMDILKRAVERFQDGDDISCTGLLFPRIEGILHTHHKASNPRNPPKQTDLVWGGPHS